MFLGIDCSSQIEVDQKKPIYRHHGKVIDPWKEMAEFNHVSYMRLRVWVDPYDEEGHPYGGGTNDYHNFVILAKRAIANGFKILLNPHYSDFWCDPGKQTMPKAWRGLDFEELVQKVYDYTHDLLTQCQRDGIPVSAIQIGNETTNGILWPHGHLEWVGEGKPRKGYDKLSRLFQAGCQAAHDVDPKIVRLIHLEQSGMKALHEEYISQILNYGVDFEAIAESFYPYWHGPYEPVFDNFDNLTAKFHKPIWIVETGYGFTMEPYVLRNDYGATYRDNMFGQEFFKENHNKNMIFPLTQEGQRDFIEGLFSRCLAHGVAGIFYWEPTWLPLPGVTWANLAGEKYINETNKPIDNEWANECLFDYDGNATLGFDSFRI